MTDREMIHWLFTFGYFNSPEALAVGGVQQQDLDKLTLTDKPVVGAVQALQRTDSNFQVAVAAAHPGNVDRIGIPDGDVGPGTAMLMELPRCGCLMFPNPNVAAAMPLDRGSWDTGCVPQYPDKHAIIVAWSGLNLLPEPLKSNFNAIWNAAVIAQRQVGLIVIRDDKHTDPHIRASVSTNMPGGAIGYAQVPPNPSCATRLWARVNPNYNPSNWRDTWPALITHELFGHNSGQNHTSGGIMNPSIRNGPWQGWTDDDPGKPRQVGWFGGPVAPDPAPGPGPGPVPTPTPVPGPGQPLSERFRLHDGTPAQLYRVFEG